MHRFTKNITLRTTCRMIGTLFFATTMLTTSVVHAQSQTKSITPDPYFGSSGSASKAAAPSNDGSQTKNSSQQQPAKNSFAPANKPTGSTTKTGFPESAASGSTSKPEKSLIVHASQNQSAFGDGSGSKLRQIDHQEKTIAQPFRSGKVLALVGGEPIFVGDLMFQINQIIEERMAEAPEKVKEQQRQLAIPQLLPQFVESKLLYQGALQPVSYTHLTLPTIYSV